MTTSAEHSDRSEHPDYQVVHSIQYGVHDAVTHEPAWSNKHPDPEINHPGERKAERARVASAYQSVVIESPSTMFSTSDATSETLSTDGSLRSTYELTRLRPAEQKLLDASTLPLYEQKSLQIDFRLGVEKELSTCVDPGSKHLLEAAAATIEWLWFGQPNQNLPEGVALNEDGEFVFASSALESVYPDICNQLLRHRGAPLDEVSLRQDRILSSNYPDINEAFTEIAKESGVYKVLQAIVSELPERSERSLTRAEIMQRERQEEEGVRNTYGLNTTDSLAVHHDAHREYHRRTYQLDEEKVTIPEKRQVDPKRRLLDFVIAGINEQYNLVADSKIASLKLNNSNLIMGTRNDGTEAYIADMVENFSQSYAQQMGGYDEWIPLKHRRSSRLILLATYNILHPEGQSRTAQKILEQAVSEPVCPDYPYQETQRDSAILNPQVLAHLRSIDAPVAVSPLRLSRWSGFKRFRRPTSKHASADVVSEEKLRAMEERSLGQVKGRGLRQAAQHLILIGNTPPELAEHVSNYDLKMTYPKNLISSKKTAPFIPGFTLISAVEEEDYFANGTYYFKHAEEDPYYSKPEAVMTKSGRIQSVIAFAQEIGFTQLAEILQNTDSINLLTLVAALRNTSDYTFDSHREINSAHLTTEMLKKLVNDEGRLQVQCTGAAGILQKILTDIALPEAYTTIVTGDLIKRGGAISWARHAQVLVNYEGNEFVLDSTPGLSRSARELMAAVGPGVVGLVTVRGFSSSLKNMLPNLAENIQLTRAKIQAKKQVSKQDSDSSPELDLTLSEGVNQVNKLSAGDGLEGELEVVTTTSTQHKEHLAVQQDLLAERTRKLLKNYFGLPEISSNEHLYKEVTKLKKDADPVRRTFALVARSEKGDSVTAEQVESALVYLEHLKGANADRIKKIGIPKYDHSMLDSLADILMTLQLKVE